MTEKQAPADVDGNHSPQRKPRLLAAVTVGVLVIVGVVVAIVLISSSDGGEMASTGQQAPTDGDCGFPFSGERAPTQVLAAGAVDCETAIKVVDSLESAPVTNPELIGGGKTVTVDGTEWSCGPPTPSVVCESGDATVTQQITPGG